MLKSIIIINQHFVQHFVRGKINEFFSFYSFQSGATMHNAHTYTHRERHKQFHVEHVKIALNKTTTIATTTSTPFQFMTSIKRANNAAIFNNVNLYAFNYDIDGDSWLCHTSARLLCEHYTSFSLFAPFFAFQFFFHPQILLRFFQLAFLFLRPFSLLICM